MKIAIIIPFFNNWHLTHARLYEIYRCVCLETPNVEIFLIDDASTEQEVRDGISWWQTDLKDKITVRYYCNKQNIGFGGSMNVGAKLADRRGMDLFVFHSNDVKVSGNFTKELIEAVNKHEKALIGNELISYPAGWNEFESNGKNIIVPWLNGYWLACKRDNWIELGGFDLLYGKYTMEDVDLSTRAIELGYNLVPLNSKFLHHIGAQTVGYSDERMKTTQQNKEKYWNKWKNKLEEIYKGEYVK
jgi:GT2 family glycosyltransferase